MSNMRIPYSVVLAFSSFRRSLLRTALTALGIVIAIAAVIIVISSAQGVKGFLLGQFEQFGSNLIQVETRVPNTGSANSGESQQARAFGTVVTTLTLDDMKAIRRLPNVAGNYAGQMGQAVATSPIAKKTVNLFGVTASVTTVDEQGKIDRGRMFTQEEDDAQARVVILGADVARDLFADQNPVGQVVKLKNKNFAVIGTFARRGTALFFNFDGVIYVPMQTLQKQLLGIDYVMFITNKYADKTRARVTAADIEALLAARHNLDYGQPDKFDFVVQSMDDLTSALDTVIGGFTLLLVALAAISLVVGGVGIMNIMVCSVLERTFEIGLRKAVGARRQQILRQFLAEAVLITCLGGVAGIALGVLVSYLISFTAGLLGFAWAFVVPAYGVLLSVGFSVACGLVFGLYPARRAAELDPIDALRHE